VLALTFGILQIGIIPGYRTCEERKTNKLARRRMISENFY
jgi:hypothetical protein